MLHIHLQKFKMKLLVLCKMVLDTLCLNIRTSNCYALLADSTRDKSNAENFAIGARFEGKVTKYVFALCQMPAAHAMTISYKIFDSLLALSIPLDKVISCSFD